MAQIVNTLGHKITPPDDCPTVTFQVNGPGVLSEVEVAFDPGNTSAQTTLTARWPGTIAIEASAGNDLHDGTAKLDVGWPWALTMISLISGGVGGFIAALPKRFRNNWWKTQRMLLRAVTGVVTGFVLYWAMALIVVGSIPHTVAMNPLAVIVLATFGGWAGPGVFSWLGEQLHFKTPAETH